MSVEHDPLEDTAVPFLTRRGRWHAEVIEDIPTRAMAVRERIRALFADPARARRDLESYTKTYRGAFFDHLTRSTPPGTFTAQDLVAIGGLSESIPIEVAAAILDTDHAELGRLLAAVPDDVDIWEARDEDLSPAYALWSRLSSYRGMGRVRTSKLLAAKRCRLVPMWDRNVKAALGLRDDDNQWELWRAALADDDTRQLIVGATPGVAERLSIIRRLDIVAWRSGETLARSGMTTSGDATSS